MGIDNGINQEIRVNPEPTESKNNRKSHLEVFKSIAERKGIKLVEGGLFAVVDGIECMDTRFPDDRVTISVNTDGTSMNMDRAKQVGTFCVRNNRLAYVDEQGQLVVGRASDENINLLIQAGYQNDFIFVPFTNGERPVEESVYEKIRDIFTGKKPEQLHRERETKVEKIMSERQLLFGEVAVLPDRQELYRLVADRREERSYSREEIRNEEAQIIEKLKPKTETDESGFGRIIYTLGEKTFSFRGREELPVYATLNNSRSKMLGEKPKLIPPADVNEYEKKVESTQSQKDAKEHLVASKTLLGVVDLAIEMGSRDATLPQLSQELRDGIYSPRAVALIDALAAANYAEMKTYGDKKKNSGAEVLVLMSLMGDKQAQDLVVSKMRMIEKVFYKGIKAENTEKSDKVEPLKTQDLCAVHATRYKPAGKDGQYEVLSSFIATDGREMRNSVHVALNHKVESHSYGSWGDAGYVLISPFESMMKSNGVPTVLNTVDTYWQVNLGESLHFKEAILVCPGGDMGQDITRTEGSEIRYKSENFNISDILKIFDQIKSEPEKNGVISDFEDSVGQALLVYSWNRDKKWDYEKALELIKKRITPDKKRGYYDPKTDLIDYIRLRSHGDYRETSIEDFCRDLVVNSGVDGAINEDLGTEEREAAKNEMAKILADKIKSVIFDKMTRLATEQAILQMGFKVQPGGMWAWGGSWEVTSQTQALSEKLGVITTSHGATGSKALEDSYSGNLKGAIDEEAGFDWKKFNDDYNTQYFNQNDFRLLYAAGILNARG